MKVTLTLISLLLAGLGGEAQLLSSSTVTNPGGPAASVSSSTSTSLISPTFTKTVIGVSTPSLVPSSVSTASSGSTSITTSAQEAP
ncbi:hypothetical protein AX14_003265 [Amanita brunnescens Koide BX004]|nr:hypothetical protein AX14_003265 [Amanita brunnescens Koide BX004]